MDYTDRYIDNESYIQTTVILYKGMHTQPKWNINVRLRQWKSTAKQWTVPKASLAICKLLIHDCLMAGLRVLNTALK